MVTMGRKIGIAILFLFVISMAILLKCNFFMVGPGLPPSDGLPYLLIPYNYQIEPDNWQVNGSFLRTPEFERLAEYEWPPQPPNETHPPVFPDLSLYSGSGYFVKPGHAELILIRVWYFEDYKNFTVMQGQLREYLETNGNTDTQWLNISVRRPDWNSTCEAEANTTLKTLCYGPTWKQFQVTSYSDNTTAGYFFATERPLLPAHDDFFIEYYGIFNSTHPSESLQTLNEFMEFCNSGYGLMGNKHPLGEIGP